jgi:hypothetical protein
MSIVEDARPKKKPLSWIAVTLIVANLGLACLVAGALYTFGSVGCALGYLRGERLFAHAGFVEGATGEERQFDLVVVNMFDQPVRIVGGASACSCLVPLGLPALLPANDKHNLRIKFRPKRQTGRFTQRLRLFMDHTDQEHLDAWVECKVAEADTSAKNRQARRGR